MSNINTMIATLKKFVFSVLTFFFAIIFFLNFATAEYLVEADKLYDLGGPENIKQSIDLYLKALKTKPDDYEVNWKCARAYRDYGDKVKKQNVHGWKDICAEYGKAGMHYAQKAKQIEPDKPDGHYYYGLSVGVYSDGVSILTALKEGLKNKTQSSFEKAYALDKMYDDAGPILSLSRFWAVIPWPFRDRKKSLNYYREYQATRYFADNAEAQIFLAELLLQLGGKKNKAEAKSCLENVLQTDDKYLKNWANRILTEIK